MMHLIVARTIKLEILCRSLHNKLKIDSIHSVFYNKYEIVAIHNRFYNMQNNFIIPQVEQVFHRLRAKNNQHYPLLLTEQLVKQLIGVLFREENLWALVEKDSRRRFIIPRELLPSVRARAREYPSPPFKVLTIVVCTALSILFSASSNFCFREKLAVRATSEDIARSGPEKKGLSRKKDKLGEISLMNNRIKSISFFLLNSVARNAQERETCSRRNGVQ